MTRCNFRKATAQDSYEFYGKPPCNTFRGIVAEIDGRVIGIGGLFYEGKARVAFSDMKPEMKQHRKDIARACRMLIDIVKEAKAPVYSVCDTNEPTSFNLLKKLGFVSTGITGPMGEILIWKEK